MVQTTANWSGHPVLAWQVGDTITYAGEMHQIAKLSAGGMFSAFIKPISIGAIAIAGVTGLIKMRKSILGSLSIGFKGKSKTTAAAVHADSHMKTGNVLSIQFGTTLDGRALLHRLHDCGRLRDRYQRPLLGGRHGDRLSASFLFTPVVAEAIAIVGVTPVSGMTLVTVVLASVVMAGIDLAGKPGVLVALVIGTVICTAFSVSGALISDFKIAYWSGATPRHQQIWRFLGLAVASLTVAMVTPLTDQSYHSLINADGRLISGEEVLPAPQANMIATVVNGLLSAGEQLHALFLVSAAACSPTKRRCQLRGLT
jgi:uncharacterized oligopeptide transporter (OPT) family protein